MQMPSVAVASNLTFSSVKVGSVLFKCSCKSNISMNLGKPCFPANHFRNNHWLILITKFLDSNFIDNWVNRRSRDALVFYPGLYVRFFVFINPSEKGGSVSCIYCISWLLPSTVATTGPWWRSPDDVSVSYCQYYSCFFLAPGGD